MQPRTAEETVQAVTQMGTVTDGGTYRDRRTGWVGAALVPKDVTKTPMGRDRRPKVGLIGPSLKEDRDNEIRLAYLDDLEPVDGEPTGFNEKVAV